MQLTLARHYPVYPVCADDGTLLGLVRGQTLFEAKAFEITAQAGSMVGVEREERISTPLWRAFRFRHPWLQLNLLTAFLAGAVVALFQGTIDQLVILAAFLPVLAGQSGNTGCQALAVTLRGITLGEIRDGDGMKLVTKEGVLGALNGGPVGLIAGVAMYITATGQQSPNALMLALVVFLAMVGSCTVSGICGAMVPLTLKRYGADPATASSIFLTTATDIFSMGLLLGLADVTGVVILNFTRWQAVLHIWQRGFFWQCACQTLQWSLAIRTEAKYQILSVNPRVFTYTLTCIDKIRQLRVVDSSILINPIFAGGR